MKKIICIILILSNLPVFSQNLEQQVNEVDTTKLVVQVYSFNKNFSIDTSGIDTTQRHIELYAPYEKSLLPVINLGQIGTPSISPIFFKQKYCEDFMFLNPYSQYLYSADNLMFLKTNNPYTMFKYLGGTKMKEEQFIDAIHSQTPNPQTNFGLKFRLFTSMNLAKPLENSSIINFNVWVHKNFKRYDLFFAIFTNKVKRIENGGIIDDQDSIFIPIPTNIKFYYNHVYNNISNKNIFLSQSYDLSTSLKIKLLTKYATYSRTFSEPELQDLFGTPLITDEQTFDSTGLRTFDNTLALGRTKKYTASIAFTHRMQLLYYFRGFLYNLNGSPNIDDFLEGHISKLSFANFYFNFDAQYHFTGRNRWNYDFSASQIYLNDRIKGLKIRLKEQTRATTPDYFYIHYNGNYNAWDNQDFVAEKRTSFDFYMSFDSLQLSLGANYSLVDNFIYFDSQLKPLQDSTQLSVQTFWLEKSFRLKYFVLDFNAYYQSPSDTTVVNLPEITAWSSMYFDLPLFKDALHLNFGFDIYYFTPFYTYSYAPTIGQFYLDKSRKTAQYPLVNFFLTGKIQSAIIIIRVDNLTSMFLPPFYYETTTHYHYNYYFLRFGVQWWFKN